MKQSRKQKKKLPHAVDSELKSVYKANLPDEKTGQPTPQPKEYDEIEY